MKTKEQIKQEIADCERLLEEHTKDLDQEIEKFGHGKSNGDDMAKIQSKRTFLSVRIGTLRWVLNSQP